MKKSQKVQKAQTMDEKLGVVMARCEDAGVACLVHPRYTARKKPTTKCNFKNDGCTCHIYWTFLCKLTELLERNTEFEELSGKKAPPRPKRQSK